MRPARHQDRAERRLPETPGSRRTCPPVAAPLRRARRQHAESGAPDSSRRPRVGSLRRADRPLPPSVSLPKGGGAIRDIGEKFTVSAATGTASLAVPVATSPGRAGFGPSLSLAYDSGAGNGPFGLGWNVSLPAITRKTDKGLPRYHDDPDQDTFILSGAEDLVPVREERDGAWEQVPEHRSVRGGGSWSSATGRGSRACSPGSSAGAT